MTLAHGRVLRGATVTPAPLPAPRVTRGHRLPVEVAAAHEQASVVLRAAEQRAIALLREAERNAAETRLRAEEVGRAHGLAEAARVMTVLRAREAEVDAAGLERTLALARLLAERLVGRAMDLEPAVVASLARQVLAEARGARRITLVAHPDQAGLLRGAMAGLDPEGRLHAVSEDPDMARGDLRLETELGVIEARLSLSLDRLAVRLGEALRT